MPDVSVELVSNLMEGWPSLLPIFVIVSHSLLYHQHERWHPLCICV